MNKAQKIVLGFLTIAIVLILILLVIYLKTPADGNPDLPRGIIFYYGETCPHCKIVEAFMTENNVNSKLNVTLKESFGNLVNAQELIKVGTYCKIDKTNIGAVPMIYSEGKCYLGDIDTVNFLKSKLNQTKAY